MARFFLDTSALVRRYDRTEPGSVDVREICTPARSRTLFLARTTSMEVASAFGRKRREGAFTVFEEARLWRLFLLHWESQFHIVPLTDWVCEQAEGIARNHPVRAFDAVQISCALTVAVGSAVDDAVTFWTADQRQELVARELGLRTRLII